MRRLSYVLWAGWLVAGIVLKILGLVSWWVAASALWIPLGGAVSFAAIIFITADLSAAAKRKRRAKIPKECATCMFGRTTDLLNKFKKEGEPDAQCIGEKLANATRGVVCKYYQRQE